MCKDAEAHAEEDAKRRDEVEARNQAENLCYQVEKTLSENGDKIPADKKAPVETAVADLKGALKGGSMDEIKAKQDALNKAMEAITQEMYSQQPGAEGQPGAGAPGADAGQGSAGQSGGSDDGDVIDADFTMMDDDKK
jgi:molecular chaperone DnaK